MFYRLGGYDDEFNLDEAAYQALGETLQYISNLKYLK